MSTRKAIQNSMTGAATNWDWNNSFTRMRSNTSWGAVLWRLVGRVWYTKSQPHSWIFTSVSVGSSPRTLLISATVRIPVHPAPKLAQNLFRVQPGTASRCNINRAITFLMCWQRPFRPFRYCFGAAHGIRCSFVTCTNKFDYMLKEVIHKFTSLV